MKQIKNLFGIFAMAGIFIAAAFSTGCSDDSEEYYASGDFEYTLAEETMLRGKEHNIPNVITGLDTSRVYSYNLSLECPSYYFSYNFEATIFVKFRYNDNKLCVDLQEGYTPYYNCHVNSAYLIPYTFEGTYRLGASGINDDGAPCSGIVNGLIFGDN